MNPNWVNPDLADIYPSETLHSQIIERYLPEIVSESRAIIAQMNVDWHVTSFFREMADDLMNPTFPIERKRRALEILLFDQVKDRWPPNETLSPDLVHAIIAAYEQHGFVFQYFGFMNIHSPFVQARLGQLVPDPRSFERAVSSTLELYPRVLQVIANPPDLPGYNHLTGEQIIHPGTLEHVRGYQITPSGKSGRIHWEGIPGWTKEALRQAIVDAGLGVQGANGKMILPGNKVKIRVGRTRGNTGNLPGIYNRVNQIRATRQGSTPYMPRSYYEALYRKIFNTPIYIDWTHYCQGHRSTDFNWVRFIAINDMGYSPPDIRNRSFPELCQLLAQESQRRRELLRSVAEEATEIAPAIILQPGGAFAQPTRPEYFRPVPVPERIRPEYQELYMACQDPAVTKGYLIFLADRMGIRNLLPPNLNKTTKDEICRILRRYVGILEETRRPI